MDINKLPATIKNSLVESLLSHQKVEILESETTEELFDRWCNYEGLINYGAKLRWVLCELRKLEKKPCT